MINSEMEHSWRQEGNILLRDDERIDDLQRNHYGIIQRKGTFCFEMDAVLLSGFAVVKPGEKALDLGTGTGIIPILLEAKTEGRHFTGLDISCYDLHLFFQVIVFHTSPGHIRRLFLDLKTGKMLSFCFCL